MIFEFFWFVAIVVAAGILGAVLHETAHYLVWLVGGRQPRVNLRELEVDWTQGPEQVLVRDRLAAVAPIILGVLVLPVVVRSGGFAVWIGWVVLTLGGARSDWQVALG